MSKQNEQYPGQYPGQYADPELAKALKKVFYEIQTRDAKRLTENDVIDENNIFQTAIKHNREVVQPFLKDCLKDGSGIIGIENWDKFYTNFKAGKSSLILAEHKSNLDVVIFYYLMKEIGRLEAFDEIAFIAGRKLNEESVTVRLFAEMFNRLVVVPKSETIGASDEEMQEIYKINYAAQQFLKQKINNYIYLIYPTGTRSRIWEPETYEGITETVNYLEKFDQVIFMSADGNCMFPMPNILMADEPLVSDQIIIRFSEPVSVKDFIAKQKELFTAQHPNGNRQELKFFITKAMTDTIYAQKPVPPQDETWAKQIKLFLESEQNN